jgi:NHS family xanthosine MFS transporter
MTIKTRLTIMSFLQFFVWGAWLITIANFWFGTKGWDGTQFGLVFATMGFASIFMPTLTGIIADRWLNAEKLYGMLHILYGITLFSLTFVETPSVFISVMFVAMCFYMPTISLSNSVSYAALKGNGNDVVKEFPPIRVWGTIGFIIAMWVTNLTGSKASENQFYIAGTIALLLGLYAFSLPKTPPQRLIKENASFAEISGLGAFKLFANYKMALFFIFSMFLGGALQLTNAYGDVFIDEFKHFPKYLDSFVVKYSTIIMSISQISETLFILAIPFFLKRFGIKKVMLFSMIAWVLRFGLFAYGDPSPFGLSLIIFSCVVYGMAFDFFNISGSLFVESNTTAKIRSSAQGLFMMMTNGFGAVLGSLVSGWAIDKYFTKSFTSTTELATYLQTETNNESMLEFIQSRGITITNGIFDGVIQMKDWHSIWISFAMYALVITVLFAVLFKHKHNPEELGNISH